MYELIERIAVGGMAEIYLARELDADTGEYLVVKRILPHFAVDRELVDMFLDEQRVAATLQHDNIVRTYDVGEVDGEYFISMEYLHGEDVRRIFRGVKKQGEQLPVDVALSIVIGAAAGLHYAHDKRGVNFQPLDIVHRDVTPHNLILTYDGVVKLVDFGVAKAANRQNSSTQAGTVKGKVAYMSPEQCKGIALDRRSDIYALGIVLYELTTGTRLYGAGGGEFATMRRIVEEAAEPPSARVPGYPEALERIVLRALHKEPEQRYQSALEMQQDLEAFARSYGLETSTGRLSRFMHELFPGDILAWEAADGDITKLIDRLIAKHSDTAEGVFEDDLSDDDIVFHLEEWSSTSLRSHASGEESGSKHIGSSLSASLESVWGAADVTAKSARRRSQTLLFPRSSPSRPGIAELESASPVDESAAGVPGTEVRGARGEGERGEEDSGSGPVLASGTGPATHAAPAPGVAASSGDEPARASGRLAVQAVAMPGPGLAPAPQARRAIPWLWIGLLVAGMVAAFLLGRLL